MRRASARLIAIGVFIGVFASAPAAAQTYPAKPVRLIVGIAAGGPTDVIARVLAQQMTASMGQTVVVDAGRA